MQKNNFLFSLFFAGACLLSACNDEEPINQEVEDPSNFTEVGSIDLGGEGAAEISTFDPISKRLFVQNNDGSSRINIIDLSNPASPLALSDLNVTGGGINSVAVKNGLLAVAVEGINKQDAGQVVVFDASTLSQLALVTVGALPDMVTFSPDGKYILSANEGEPSDDYTNDPEGSISIIDIENGYQATTLGFSQFSGQLAALSAQGYRVFGPNASMAQDTEPEYVTVSDDSKTAWVSLQENNALAKVDIASKTITAIMPLGFKDFSLTANAIDASNRDNGMNFAAWPVKGMYMPDAIAYFNVNGTGYIISANEGDSRDYDGFSEEERVKDVVLDPSAFPNAAELQADAALGRLKITSTLGDTDGDGDYDELYAYGARSFSIWNAETGMQTYDCGSSMEMEVINTAGFVNDVNGSHYDDDRSDDKGTEPEGVVVGVVGGKMLAFIGLERVDIVMVYDISTPTSPQFLQLLKVGDAPEGLWFVSATDSPNGRSLLIVSSEDDGQAKIFQPELLIQ